MEWSAWSARYRVCLRSPSVCLWLLLTKIANSGHHLRALGCDNGCWVQLLQRHWLNASCIAVFTACSINVVNMAEEDAENVVVGLAIIAPNCPFVPATCTTRSCPVRLLSLVFTQLSIHWILRALTKEVVGCRVSNIVKLGSRFKV